MNTAVINFKTDAALKASAQQVAKDLGVSLSVVINNSLRRFVAERKIVLEATEHISPAAEKRILQAFEDAKDPKNLSPAFTNAADAAAWLRA